MMADSLRTDFKSDSKNTHSKTNNNVPDIIDLNDPKSMEILKKMSKT